MKEEWLLTDDEILKALSSVAWWYTLPASELQRVAEAQLAKDEDRFQKERELLLRIVSSLTHASEFVKRS